MIKGPDERYQIATSAFHCILSGSPNEAAFNTYSAGVMAIRIAGSSCRRPQLLFDNFFFLTLDRTLGFLSLRRQPVDLFSKIFYSCNQTNNPLDHSQSPNDLQREKIVFIPWLLRTRPPSLTLCRNPPNMSNEIRR